MKLELKDLAPYLPFELKGVIIQDNIEDFYFEDYFEEEKFKIGAVWTLCGYAEGDLNITIGEGVFDGFLWRSGMTYVNFHHTLKPILRPLSDLKNYPGNTLLDFDVLKYTNDIKLIRYGDVLWLLEQHFDIFGLIDKNLAIDINTLN